jgi:hypothetical protein
VLHRSRNINLCSPLPHSIALHAGLLPYIEIDSNAPFSVALGKFFPWASYVVSIGACAGTFNSAFADLYAMSRLMVVLSRCRLIPEFMVSWCMLHLLYDCYKSVKQCSGRWESLFNSWLWLRPLALLLA